MSKDPLLSSVFQLIAIKQTRGKDIYYKAKKSEFTKVLQALQIVQNIKEANSKVDRMWELLVEIVLFFRTRTHRNPIEILKSFIRARTGQPTQARVSAVEQGGIRRIFEFLSKAYRNKKLSETRL